MDRTTESQADWKPPFVRLISDSHKGRLSKRTRHLDIFSERSHEATGPMGQGYVVRDGRRALRQKAPTSVGGCMTSVFFFGSSIALGGQTVAVMMLGLLDEGQGCRRGGFREGVAWLQGGSGSLTAGQRHQWRRLVVNYGSYVSR